MALPPARDLPRSVYQVLGRASEIDSLTADLQISQLVTIVGPGGVGKTTVAIEIARRHADVEKEAVCFVDFAALRDPVMAPVAIAEAIGLKVGSTPVLSALCDGLRDRRMLLLLDNCEHLVEDAAECADRILSAARGVRILATSREPLEVRGERVRRLHGLSFPETSIGLKAVDALTFPAIQLFVERATQRWGSFTLRDQDAPATAEVCRRLDGLALAIELAGTRVDTFTVDGILEQLDDRFRTLSERREGPERQRSLTATLDWSFELMSADEVALLDAVSVFAGAFGAGDAAGVAEVAPDEALETLAQLAAKSLISSQFEGNRTLFRLLETTRSYCVMRLQASGQLDAMQRRHATYVRALLLVAAGEWSQMPAREWGDRYRLLLNDLRIALAWAWPRDPKLLVELTAAGALLWNHFSLTEESRDAILRAISKLDQAGLSGTQTEMRLQTFLAGALIFTHGPGPEMLEASERALCIADALCDTEFRLRSLWTIGSHKIFSGEYDAAIARMKTFLSIAGDQDSSAVPGGEAMLAAAEFYAGDLDNALKRIEAHFRPDLSVLERPKLARFQFASNSTFGVILAMVQWTNGWPGRAAETIELVLQETLRTGHKMEIISVLVMSACPIALLSKNYNDAHRYLALLDQVLDESGLEVWRPVALHYRGALMCAEKDTLIEGIGMLEASIDRLERSGQKLRRAFFLGTLANALARVGRLAEATSTIVAALDHSAKSNERWCLPELLRIRGSVFLAENRLKEAEEYITRAMASAQDLGMLSWQLRASNDLATMLQAEGRASEARVVLEPIHLKLVARGETEDIRRSRRLLESQ